MHQLFSQEKKKNFIQSFSPFFFQKKKKKIWENARGENRDNWHVLFPPAQHPNFSTGKVFSDVVQEVEKVGCEEEEEEEEKEE